VVGIKFDIVASEACRARLVTSGAAEACKVTLVNTVYIIGGCSDPKVENGKRVTK
jgi:hypothetical protein